MVIPLHPPTTEPVDVSPSGKALGAKEAEHAVLLRLTGRIRRVTRLFLKDSADAEDAAQVALLKILSVPSPREPSDPFEDWAQRVAVGVALQWAKRERRRQHLLLRWLVPDRLPWGQEAHSLPHEDPSLEEAIRRLSAAQREAFVLRHILEYSIAEVAELTQTPAGTIKNRLLAARKALRKEFGGKSR
jgi:RNA polymerase sigma-70 factor, ECF subfamily